MSGTRTEGSYTCTLPLGDAVLAVEEAVVGGEEDQRAVELARRRERLDDACDGLVHGEERLEPLPVVLGDARDARRAEQRGGAAHAGGLVRDIGLVEGRRRRQRLVREAVAVAWRRHRRRLVARVVGVARPARVRRQERDVEEERLGRAARGAG